jgi:hypothetical protein
VTFVLGIRTHVNARSADGSKVRFSTPSGQELLRPMWNIHTAWFDVAVVMTIFAVGNILFGHFEEHRPKLRRVLKVVIVLGITVGLSLAGLRWVAAR